MHPSMQEVVKNFIRDNENAQRAFEAMTARGVSRSDAEAEVAKVMLACLWEANQAANEGTPLSDTSQLDDALNGLAEGRTAEELFPDA